MAQAQWQRIMDHFRSRIESGDLNPGDRLPSDVKLAEDWKVSRPTAHRALAELQRLGLVARSKGSGTIVTQHVANANGRVALIVDRMDPRHNFPHSELVRGIQDALGENVSLVIAQCDNDYRREARQIERLSQEVDGILVYPISDPRNNECMQRVREGGTPIVALDRYPEGLQIDLVVTDNYGASANALRHMASKGHKRIAFFSFHKPDFSSVQERHQAFCDVMAENGVGNPESLTRWFPSPLEAEPVMLIQAMKDALMALTLTQQKISAVFCVQDFIAAATLEAMEGIGLELQKDLDIAFFNDWPPLMFRAPWGLHRIVQSVYGLGRCAAELLMTRMSGDNSEPQLVKVPADLIPAEDHAPQTALSPAMIYATTQTNAGY